jgi:hypothetical protein
MKTSKSEEGYLLPLEADVLGPLHKARQVTLGLDILQYGK